MSSLVENLAPHSKAEADAKAFRGLWGIWCASSVHKRQVKWGACTARPSGDAAVSLSSPGFSCSNFDPDEPYSAQRNVLSIPAPGSDLPWHLYAVLRSLTQGDIMPPRLLLLFEEDQEHVVGAFADVLNAQSYLAQSLKEAQSRWELALIGLPISQVGEAARLKDVERTTIAACAINADSRADEHLLSLCDYEYCYDARLSGHRDIARFLHTILGCKDHLSELRSRLRSTLLSTTFSDIRVALPNLDILSIGVDAVEVRVDLLTDLSASKAGHAMPGIKVVAEQIMLLRQRTELPIVFNIRCTQWNGRFPMDDPGLCFQYLHKAIQWGCEYIDVELWLPEEIRAALARNKGNSKIISTWHDHSGEFRWASKAASEIFEKAAIHGDIVKMVTQTAAHSPEDNYELEFFRSTIRSLDSSILFSGLNVGPLGQHSMTENNVLTPVTHPLLPLAAVQSQMSVAEINSALHAKGKLPRRLLYVVESLHSSNLATFLEKVINEMSLPHRILRLSGITSNVIESIVSEPQFGCAFLDSPIATLECGSIPLSEAAQATGFVDTVIRGCHRDQRAIGYNMTSEGIKATLVKDFVPLAYVARPAIVAGNSHHQGISAVQALSSLGAHPIFVTGFKAGGPLGKLTRRLSSFKDPELRHGPFVIVSALSTEKKNRAVLPLLEIYGSVTQSPPNRNRVFLDLARRTSGRPKIAEVAHDLGWRTYDSSDVHASVLRNSMKETTGCFVGDDFIRFTGGTNVV